MSVLPYRYRAFRVSPSLLAFASSISTDLSTVDYKFLCFLLIKSITQHRLYFKDGDGWIPVKGRLFQKSFVGVKPEKLVTEKLIDRDGYYVPKLKARHYRVQEWVLEEVRNRIETSFNEDTESFNLCTRKPWGVDRFVKQLSKDPPIASEQPVPSLINKAIAEIHTGYYNRPAVIEHLKRLEQIAKDDPTESNRFRYLNDWFCFLTAEQTVVSITGNPNIVSYSPSYTMQRTGRVTSAMQSCSREMKFAAYTGIENIHNYDLSSSQVFIAIEEMKKYGVKCEWLEDYISEKHKRQEYADQIGIPASDWKQCLLTLLMGGTLPRSIPPVGSKHIPAIYEILCKTFKSEDDILAALEAMQEMFKEFRVSLKLWHSKVLKEAKESGVIGNAIGLERTFNSLGQRPLSPMIAHILQGAEVYFIHTLTTLAPKYGFIPIGNEHDGLITIGQIPSSAIKKAAELTGMPYLDLREKPFL